MISRHALTSTLRPISPALKPAYHTSNLLNHTTRTLPSTRPTANPDPPSTLTSTVRNLMRLVPHSLTIITSLPHPPHSTLSLDLDAPSPHGLLVSSFNTVTLHPHPFVSFNIKLPSKTYNAITLSRHFTASGIDSPQTAHAFVDGSGGGMLERDGRVKRGVGGLWWMRCEWREYMSVVVGDHVLVVGRVREAGIYGDGEGLGEKGLVYADGRYWRLGDVVGGEDLGKE